MLADDLQILAQRLGHGVEIHVQLGQIIPDQSQGIRGRARTRLLDGDIEAILDDHQGSDADADQGDDREEAYPLQYSCRHEFLLS